MLNALQDASSTICNYECDGKSYVTAFSASNALTYSIKDNTWESYRNMPNNKWVNCCCVVKDCIYNHHKTNVILLEYSDGTISVFNKNLKPIDLYKPTKNECRGIESILCFEKSNGYLIVFCDSFGKVFLINSYRDLSCNTYTIYLINEFNDSLIEEVRNLCADKTKDLKNSKKIFPTLRLTKQNEHISLFWFRYMYAVLIFLRIQGFKDYIHLIRISL